MREFDKLYFPAVVDDFFDNPDLIREFALSLDYKPDEGGRWPGVRSEQLHIIDYELFMSIMLKIMSIYTDFAYQNVEWQNASIMFHKIKDTGDKETNKGWIHIDNDYQLAGLCYLNPGVQDINYGTSIYKRKQDVNFMPFERHYYKHMFIKGNEVDMEAYKKSLKDYNARYNETIRIGNVYNRMITYSAPEHHTLNGIPEGEERLTMLLFMNGISPENNRFPINRIKDKQQYDKFIEDRIKFLNEKSITR